MDTAYVRAKGQLVVPARIRRKYGIQAGTKICFIERESDILFQPVTREYIRSICGILKSETSATKELLRERGKDKERARAKLGKLGVR